MGVRQLLDPAKCRTCKRSDLRWWRAPSTNRWYLIERAGGVHRCRTAKKSQQGLVKKCDRCGATGLVWKATNGRYRLVNAGDGSIHRCPSNKSTTWRRGKSPASYG